MRPPALLFGVAVENVTMDETVELIGGLVDTVPDADDDQRGKAEAPDAFDDLGDAIDVHKLVDELAVALFVSPLAGFTGHKCLPCCSCLRS